MDPVILPEWLVWMAVLLIVAGPPYAYRLGRHQGWKEFRSPPKHFYNHEEEGL